MKSFIHAAATALAIVRCLSAMAEPQVAATSSASVRYDNKNVKTLKVPLNDTGITDARYINPRRPVSVFNVERNRDAQKPTNDENDFYDLEFVNRTADRRFIVTLPVRFDARLDTTQQAFWDRAFVNDVSITPDAVKNAEDYFHITHLEKCQFERLDEQESPTNIPISQLRLARAANDQPAADAQNQSATAQNQSATAQNQPPAAPQRVTLIACTAVIPIEANQTGAGVLSRRLFASMYNSVDVIAFDVRLFEDNKKLSNPTGYVRRNPDTIRTGFNAPAEPADKTTLKPAASLDLVFDPVFDLHDGKPILDLDHRFDGDRRAHFPGTARVDVTHAVGNRGKADLSFAFKSSDFGDTTDTGQVIAAKYKLSIFSLNLITLDFGKYDFAAPADAIAINESGQGFTLSRGFEDFGLAASYILKRERDVTKPDTDDDNSSAILQVNNITLFESFLRSANLIAVYGKDDSNSDPHVYRTGGGEVFFSQPLAGRMVLGGSLAAFRSTRSRSDTAVKGRGTTALLKVAVSSDVKDEDTKKKPTIPHIFSGTVAYGSGDRSTSDDLDESYLGETSAFAPGLVFFKKVAEPLRSGSGKDHAFGKGLRNKMYWAVEYRNTEWSLLQLLAGALNIDDADIISKSFSVAVRKFRFRDSPYDTSDIGTEYGFVSDIETPKSVTVTFKVGYFVPGSAFRDIVADDVWSISAGVKIEP